MRIKLFATSIAMLSLLAVASTQITRAEITPDSNGTVQDRSQTMTITRSGSRTPSKGPAANFTGNVSVEPLFPENAPSGTSAGSVTFEPGARSAWHTHPAGQHLIVTAGVGRTQQWGGSVEEIKPGDVVWCPPGVKHWHGASPNTAMTHIAITESLNGENVRWLEKVSDEQYNSR